MWTVSNPLHARFVKYFIQYLHTCCTSSLNSLSLLMLQAHLLYNWKAFPGCTIFCNKVGSCKRQGFFWMVVPQLESSLPYPFSGYQIHLLLGLREMHFFPRVLNGSLAWLELLSEVFHFANAVIDATISNDTVLNFWSYLCLCFRSCFFLLSICFSATLRTLYWKAK